MYESMHNLEAKFESNTTSTPAYFTAEKIKE